MDWKPIIITAALSLPVGFILLLIEYGFFKRFFKGQQKPQEIAGLPPESGLPNGDVTLTADQLAQLTPELKQKYLAYRKQVDDMSKGARNIRNFQSGVRFIFMMVGMVVIAVVGLVPMTQGTVVWHHVVGWAWYLLVIFYWEIALYDPSVREMHKFFELPRASRIRRAIYSNLCMIVIAPVGVYGFLPWYVDFAMRHQLGK